MKGLVLIESSQESEAIEIFDDIIEKNPQHRDALFNKGLALKRLGNNDESKAVMKKALAHRWLNVDNLELGVY